MKIVAIILILFALGLVIVRQCLGKPISRHFGAGLFGAFAMIAIAGFFVHNAVLFLVVCFAAFFAGVKTPLDAACRFLLLSALTPHIVYHSYVGSAYLLEIHPTFVFIVGLITCTVLFESGRAMPRGAWSAEDAVIGALIFIAIVGVSRSPSVTALMRQILTPITSLLLPYLLLGRSIRNRSELRVFFGVVAGCAILLSAFSLYEAKFGWSLFDVYWRNFQSDTFMSRNLRLRSGFLRTPTTFNESTSFAVFQTMGVVTVLYSRPLFRSRTTWLVGCGTAGLALLAAQSRGALIGLAAGIIVVLLVRRSYARAGAAMASAGVAVGGLLILGKFSAKAASFANADAALNGQDYRQQLFWTGLQQGMKHFWIGQEGGRVASNLDSLVQGENMVDFVNTYLTFFLTSGIVGFLAFVIPLCVIFAKLWVRRDLRRRDAPARGMEAVVGSLTAIIVTLIFTSFYERNPLWLVVVLAAVKIQLRPIPPLLTRVSNLQPAVAEGDFGDRETVSVGAA